MMLLSSFSRLRDPRIARHRRYSLGDLLFIALCAMLCGADSFVEIEAWAKAKQSWLRQRLDLPETMPSHDTFGRVFARLDAKLFAECFHQWTQSIAERTKGEVIAIDGKEIRHSFDLSTGQAALHLVSAWACRQRLVLEQEAVFEKSNEITAIPALLYRLDIEGCLITIDAMGCQRALAEQIVEQKGDYCLALKGNQKDLYNTVTAFFTTSRANDWHFGEGVLARSIEHFVYQSVEDGHGRRETRRCFVAEAKDAWLTEEQLVNWAGLACVVCVESERTIRSRHGKAPIITLQQRYNSATF